MVWSSEGGAVLVGNALEISDNEALSMVPKFREYYFRVPTPLESVYPGVFNILQQLFARRIRLAICSNKPEKLCKKVLSETGLERYFEVVIGGDTLSLKKPDPAPLKHSIGLLKINSEQILYVGDSLIDKKASKAAGIDFAYFSGGYDDRKFLETGDIFFDSYERFLNDLIANGRICE